MSDTAAERSETIPAALAASTRGGVTLLGRQGSRRLPYGELLDASARVAAGLARAGVGRGERLLLVLPTSEEFLVSFFGSSLAGAVPCQVSPPEGFGSAAAFQTRLGELAKVVGARAIVALDELAARIQELSPIPVLTPAGLREGGGDPSRVRVEPDDVAFIQFTSGTTHVPKGARIPHRAVAANTRQIAEATAMVPGSVIVSWLPMFHDMGLIGLLTALFNDLEYVLSSPSHFLRRPASWLETIDRFRGTHSPAPTFAYSYAVARVSDRELEGIDLSSWRNAYVGAEPIPARVLEGFQERFGPCGLPETALVPCYGLAEATLAVTFKHHGERYRTRPASRSRLARDGRLGPPSGDPADRLELVSCGRPLRGTTVRILDEEGGELPPGRLGEIAVQGPSLFEGYHGVDDPAQAGLTGGELRTGDLGFLEDGELYVTGRKKDLIILCGQNHHPEEIEWVAARVPGVRPGRAAAFGVEDPAEGTERLCLLVEKDRHAQIEPGALEIEVRRRVHEESGLTIDALHVAEAGTLPVTTSGKIRRSRAREIFLRKQGREVAS